MFRLALALALALAAVGSARAQEAPPTESIQIGLSTDRIAITSDFRGANLTIFGALENSDPVLMGHGHYDIIVSLEGPPREVVVRRKRRVLGMWINTESQTFRGVPESYSLASTRPIEEIAAPAAFAEMSIGVHSIRPQPIGSEADPVEIAEFARALLERKQALGFYAELDGGVEFLSQTLFRATVPLATSVPVGTHTARAYLFRNGQLLQETSTELLIYKSGFEERVYRMAQNHGLIYGIGSVLLAIFTGWLGRILFRRD